MSDLVGTHLGHYHLLRSLGKGGMAEVYLAHDETLEREVAIKVVSGTNDDYLERFMREVAAIDMLAHEHILPAYDYDSEGPWRYLVMLYAPYGTLRDHLEKKPLSLDEALEMLEQVASALQFAHDHGIVHRDIKPSNILLRDAHYAYLADFGLAKSVEGSSPLTQTGILLGTPEYMAPDLADGPATSSSDIYALGIVLYEMVTGQLPFVAETPVAVYWKQLRDQPSPPSKHRPDLSPAIDAVILHALEKDPRHRFQSVHALAEAFRQAVEAPEQYLAQERQRVRLKNRTLSSVRSSAAPPRPLQRSLQSKRSARPRRLVLPGHTLSTSAEVAVKEQRSPSIALPPLPVRSRNDTVINTPEPPPPVQPIRRVSGGQYRIRQRNRTPTVVSIVALGFLLLVGLPMAYIYYVFETSHTKTTTIANTTQYLPTAQATRQSQATATSRVTATVSTGAPILEDNLTNNTHGRWAEDAAHCTFRGGSYRVQVQQTNFLQSCPLLGRFIDNAALQVEVSLLSGNNAGMLLRLQGDRFYDFEINNQGQFFFRRHDLGGGSTYTSLISPTASTAILTGGAKNTLLVIANGADFKLYINSIFVGEVQDSTYTNGQVALVAGTLAPLNSGEGSFTHFKVSRVA